ncbi:MAG: ABC transporter ATP-binding protein [Candidatus Methanomethylicia archaeon]
MIAIRAINLRKSYSTSNGRIEVIKGVSFEVRDGEFTVIMGPNGAGKTTLLRIIALLEKPDDGRLILFGTDTTSSWNNALRLRGDVTMVFQEPIVFNMSVYKNIALGVREGNVRGVVEVLAEQFKLKNVLDRNALSLSTGFRKRVMLARALACNPRILLLDEPTANLDGESREIVLRILKELLGSKTIIYVTHYLPEAQMFNTKILYMEDGVFK